MIKKCTNAIGKNATCKSKFQDKQYGKSRRVFNKTGNGRNASDGNRAGRCTVCEATKN